MDNEILINEFEAAQSMPVAYVNLEESTDNLVIDWDSREIQFPDDMTNLGVQHDHLAKKLVFEMDRYVAGKDISQHAFAIHFINAKTWDKDKEPKECNSGLYPITGIDISRPDKVLCEWDITNNSTQIAGKLVFALHIYSIVDNAYTYHISTMPAVKDLNKTINATSHGSNIPPDEVEVYIQMMNELSAQMDSKVSAAEKEAKRAEEAAANFEVDDTLSASGKAADAAVVGQKISQLSGDINNIAPMKYLNIANKIVWSAYNGFPYTQDYFDEEKEVNSSVCPSDKTTYGFFWDIPVESEHKYLLFFDAKLKVAGDSTANVVFSKQSGVSIVKAVKDVLGLINGNYYNNGTKASEYTRIANIIDATENEIVRIRGYFYPSANFDSVYAYKNITLIDITDSYNVECLGEILESDYFIRGLRTFSNQKDICEVSKRVDALEVNKLLYTYDDVKEIASNSANATVTVDEITVKGIGLDKPCFILPMKAEYQGAVVFSMYAKTSTDEMTENNSKSNIIVRYYDKNGTRIYAGQLFPIFSTNYKMYEYHSCIPLGAYKAELIFVSESGSSFTFKTFSAKKVEMISPVNNQGVHFDCHLGVLTAPMNTMEAYIGARTVGFSSLIFNLRQTSDDVLVCMHDDDISKYSNGVGLCSEMTYEQLKTYNFAHTSNNKDSVGNITNPYYDCKIVKVEEVLKMCAINGIVPVFRLGDDLDSTYTQIKEMLNRYGLNGIARCKAFAFGILSKAWEIVGNAFASYSFEVNGAFTQANIDDFKAYPYCSENSFIECKAEVLTADMVTMARENGLAVGIASTGSFALINKCIDLGATYITSDFTDGCPMIC